MTDEQKRLVEDNHNLIYHHIFKYLNGDIDYWYDILAIGLCKAAITYNNSLDTKFATYATVVMTNESRLDYKRSTNNRHIEDNRVYSLSYDFSDGDEMTLENILDSGVDVESEAVSRIAITEFVDKLKEREKTILSYLSAGLTQQEIGARLGVSQAYISRLIKSMKTKYNKLYK